MKLETRICVLQPRGAFRIARVRTTPFANVLVRLEADGIVAWGEASPNPFYGEDATEVEEAIHRGAGALGELDRLREPADLEALWDEVWSEVQPSRAAQCALDLALWDWLALRRGCSVAELTCGAEPQPVTSFVTIGLGPPEEQRAKLRSLADFPRIKIKSDATADLTLAGEAGPLHAAVAIDANASWPGDRLESLAEQCAALGVRFLEQPFPPGNDGRLRRGALPLPVFADESCVVPEDVRGLSERYDGINVKLVKCGGLTPALRMLREARSLGLQTMVGCMLETSVLIAAGCAAAQFADHADLDGAWLLEADPAGGWTFDRGVLHPPARAGLGVLGLGKNVP